MCTCVCLYVRSQNNFVFSPSLFFFVLGMDLRALNMCSTTGYIPSPRCFGIVSGYVAPAGLQATLKHKLPLPLSWLAG